MRSTGEDWREIGDIGKEDKQKKEGSQKQSRRKKKKLNRKI